jgi:uncharacterized SAM-binding protein YcdF (DUF218 family)
MDFFAVKKVIGALLSPGAGGLLFFTLSLGLAAYAGTPRLRRLGRGLVAVGLVVAWALGTTPVADALIRPFESRYAPVLDPRALAEGDAVLWVVVLGGGHTSDLRYPASAQLGSESLFRLVEGIRLYRALPDARLHLSGWGGADPRSNAQVMAEAAVAMGVPRDHIVEAPTPRDTAEEAAVFAAFLEARGEEGRPFLLVTSAAHLPRAMGYFEAEGLRPIPAPAQAYALERERAGYLRFLPSSRNYLKVERAMYEAAGAVAAWVGAAVFTPASPDLEPDAP